VWRGVGNPRPWTEGSGFGGENHICYSAGREEAWFARRRLLCVVGSVIFHSVRALLRLVSCVPARFAGGCCRMQDNGLVEGGVAVRLGSMKIGGNVVYGGWCRSPRRSLRLCYGGIHGFSGCHSRSYDRMELDFRGSHLSRYWGARTRQLGRIGHRQGSVATTHLVESGVDVEIWVRGGRLLSGPVPRLGRGCYWGRVGPIGGGGRDEWGVIDELVGRL
jgi:hypothetical protein